MADEFDVQDEPPEGNALQKQKRWRKRRFDPLHDPQTALRVTANRRTENKLP